MIYKPDRNWQHPEHAKGIKSPKIFDTIIGSPLTDKKIERYLRSGFYSNRNRYRRELQKMNKIKEIMRPEKRLIYDINTQEFEER
jgi:hypothetical protein